MNNKKILSKISKLLALAQSDNSNESALALSKARKLMNEHKLTESDVATAEILERAATQSIKAEKPPEYVSSLVEICCRLFQCVSYWQCGYRLTSGNNFVPKSTPIFIGHEMSVEVCQYTYDVLYRKLKRARKNHPTPRHLSAYHKTVIKDSYAEGWVCGVYRSIKHMVPDSIEVEVQTETGIMIIDPLAVYLSNKSIDSELKTKTMRHEDSGAISEGYTDGAKVQINKGMAGDATHQKSLKQ